MSLLWSLIASTSCRQLCTRQKQPAGLLAGLAHTSRIYLTVLPSPLHFLQPILSPSILDHLINNDRKLPPEYNLPHTYVEMQVR